MALFVTEHSHPADRCPAADPHRASGLLALIANAGRAGLTVRGDAVTAGRHHLYLIVEAADEDAVRTYFAPFGQLGSLTITPASHCEEVVRRGAC